MSKTPKNKQQQTRQNLAVLATLGFTGSPTTIDFTGEPTTLKNIDFTGEPTTLKKTSILQANRQP